MTVTGSVQYGAKSGQPVTVKCKANVLKLKEMHSGDARYTICDIF